MNYRRFANLTFLLIPVTILWLGLVDLQLGGTDCTGFFWQATMYTVVLSAVYLLNKLLGYQGEQFMLPTIACLIAMGLIIQIRINPLIAHKQFWWAIFGLVLASLATWGLKDYRRLARYQFSWAMTAVVLLAVTLLFGVTSGGATSWFRIGSYGIEPEELVKIVLIIFLAIYLKNNRELLTTGTARLGRFAFPELRIFGPLLMMVAISLLLLTAQKSLGTALVFYMVVLMMVYIATGKGMYLVIGIPVFMITGFMAYKLFGHVHTRIDIWLDPWNAVYGNGSQIAQSLFAIGNGGVFGMGLGSGFGAVKIPAAETDFIFAVIAEEFGFLGAMAIIILFLILIYRCFSIALSANDEFGTLLASGFGFLFAFEALIILAGVTKLLPLTGIPLPWVSYGGNSILVHMLMLGCLSNISHVSLKNLPDGHSRIRKGMAND